MQCRDASEVRVTYHLPQRPNRGGPEKRNNGKRSYLSLRTPTQVGDGKDGVLRRWEVSFVLFLPLCFSFPRSPSGCPSLPLACIGYGRISFVVLRALGSDTARYLCTAKSPGEKGGRKHLSTASLEQLIVHLLRLLGEKRSQLCNALADRF